MRVGLKMCPEIETAPSHQDILPNDILVHIFVLISQDHGPVAFPIRKHQKPPQLVLSRVCLRWRMLALSTFELWNNVRLDDISLLHHGWLLRAGSFPKELSLQCTFWDETEATRDARIIQDALSNLKPQIKMFHIELTFRQFKALSNFPNSILSHIQKLELEFNSDDVDETFCIVPISFTKLQSVILSERHYWAPLDWNVLLKLSLPWSQLRSLKLHLRASDLIPFFNTLRQMSLLQELYVCIRSFERLAPLEKKLTISSLRRICLDLFVNDEDGYNVICNINCPDLVELDMKNIRCSKEIYAMIKQQYNLQELAQLSLVDSVIPASSILKDAPKLQKIRMNEDMNDEAIAGLSNGTLGPYLKELTIVSGCDINRLLSMVEKRKRTVDRLIENGCNWRELITVLRKVDVCYGKYCNELMSGYMERVNTLEEEGITVTLPEQYT